MGARSWLRSLIVVCLSVGAAPSSSLATATTTATSEEHVRVFDTCWRLVQRFFYDRDLNGLDWKEVRERYRPRALEADDGQELRRILQEMLAELDASHASVMDREVYRDLQAELDNERTWTHGLLLEETRPGKLFVRSLYEGGAAEAAGLTLGDEILLVNGEAPFHSERLLEAGYDPALPGPGLFFLEAGKETVIRLRVRSTPSRGSAREVELEPRWMNGVDAARNSVRIVDVDGRRIGLVHLWYCQRGVDKVLREAIQGKLEDCDALVVDLRGRGGYVNVVDSILGCFERGRSLTRRLRNVRPWKKPVVFLIDERSRSAKEILAYHVRRHEVGILVGRKTEGAVLGAGFFKLPDGSILELPITRVPVGDVDLEGLGVEPHVEVEVDLPYAQGEDPILVRGIEVALEQTRPSRRILGPF